MRLVGRGLSVVLLYLIDFVQRILTKQCYINWHWENNETAESLTKAASSRCSSQDLWPACTGWQAKQSKYGRGLSSTASLHAHRCSSDHKNHQRWQFLTLMLICVRISMWSILLIIPPEQSQDNHSQLCLRGGSHCIRKICLRTGRGAASWNIGHLVAR